MSNDLKATITGLVTSLLTLLAHFIPALESLRATIEPIIIAVGIAALSYFTNKPDAVKPTTPPVV